MALKGDVDAVLDALAFGVDPNIGAAPNSSDTCTLAYTHAHTLTRVQTHTRCALMACAFVGTPAHGAPPIFFAACTSLLGGAGTGLGDDARYVCAQTLGWHAASAPCGMRALIRVERITRWIDR